MTNLLNKILPRATFAKGEVALVGAGPGDPELLTVKALRFIAQAEVVIYDRLVSDEIMALLPADCERFYVGKKQAQHCVPQNNINEVLVQYAKQHKRVLRLKGGDPFIFGRGSEEAEHLLNHGISCHVLSGITAASASTTYAGIPLTHRGVSQCCTFITGHLQNDGQLVLPWQSLNNDNQTVVFYMGISAVKMISEKLIEHGRAGTTPAAIIRQGTRPDQQEFRGTLATLEQMVIEHDIKPPALIVVGDVINQLDPKHIAGGGYFQAEAIKQMPELSVG
ncbi:uroporphyrinogen-III C-methyltransferase [Thalassotalea sp. ND16A]|uniref:uroporphyrinogen-III C-methyltransferase n=1 Tax=Thalassotalea sp. ND16A TaxID=1535422 RepID=UPI00051D02A0|nr:uroporphyrinogen-III C-methyltransferase [Thalassotalea sp. ND16A]KGJ88071.1 Uroporphyrinogen-III C-methyltransferase [Thalassotalea sp. ND16A]